MSDSPLFRRARERMAAQREKDRQQWEVQPAALQKGMIRWILRLLGFAVLVGLILYRLHGGSVF